MMGTKSKSNRRWIVTAVLALFLLPMASAASQHGNGQEHQTEFGRPGSAAQVSRTIPIDMKEYRFSPSRISIKKGETIRFWLHNRGKLTHTMSIGTAAYHVNRQKELAITLVPGVKPSRSADVEKLANRNSVILEPGEFREFIWTFVEGSELVFGCDIPGHYDSGMVGLISFR